MTGGFSTRRDAKDPLTSGHFREEEERGLLGEFRRSRPLARFSAEETGFEEGKRAEKKGSVEYVVEDLKTNS